MFTAATTIISSVAVAIITARITTRGARENEMRKRIHEKRLDIYLEFHDVLEKMLLNRDVIFEREYYDEMVSFKPQIKLLASNDVVEQYRNLFECVKAAVNGYEKFKKEHDPEFDLKRIMYDEEGNQVGYDEPTAEEYEAYEGALNRYKSEKRLSKEETQKLTGDLYEAMRDDLGSNLDEEDTINGFLQHHCKHK